MFCLPRLYTRYSIGFICMFISNIFSSHLCLHSAHPGDQGFLPVLRKATTEFGLQVLLLHPLVGTAQEYISSTIPKWRCDWKAFIAKHSKSRSSMRMPDAKVSDMVASTAADSIKNFKEIGKHCIVILMDVTHSMGDCITAVKDKIKTQLLDGLFER